MYTIHISYMCITRKTSSKYKGRYTIHAVHLVCFHKSNLWMFLYTIHLILYILCFIQCIHSWENLQKCTDTPDNDSTQPGPLSACILDSTHSNRSVMKEDSSLTFSVSVSRSSVSMYVCVLSPLLRLPC